jgi:hypothetical protein
MIDITILKGEIGRRKGATGPKQVQNLGGEIPLGFKA